MTIDFRAIHTLNARGHGMLEVVRDRFTTSPAQMMAEIHAIRSDVEAALALKHMRYEDLRSALVPDPHRREIALVFESAVFADSDYGRAAFECYMPLFDERSDHSVLDGDYLTHRAEEARFLAEAFKEAVRAVRPVAYRHSTQFYLVYINNLTDAMIERFDSRLRTTPAYVGYADMTYGSTFKFLASTMLPLAFIKKGRTILVGHEDDLPNDEDWNLIGWPFARFGYTIRSIQSYLIGTLLTFKIERPVFDARDTDTQISLNAISASPLPLREFSIDVEPAKLDYLKREKAGSLGKADLGGVTTTELQRLIAGRIDQSYIYHLNYRPASDVATFNIIIELPGSRGPVRLLASLEYKATERALRLVTLY
ncbi:hypothetical protein EAH87_06530 [Sphingomonas koreensis]|nr:hypothetical protein EAH87_06530 [Sphingomonas koreensis]